jgi:hypothetical protein
MAAEEQGEVAEPAPLQQHSSAVFDDGATENKLKLTSDLYTYAFVAALEPPYTHPTRGAGFVLKICDALGPITAMLSVSLIQILMGYAVYLHVENDLIHTHTRPLHTAYEMFVGSNITVPLHTVEALCGQWEDQEMKDFSQGPLRTIKMPDGTVFSPDDRYSLFYNLKQPTRTWDYGRLGSERSVLDDVMFVISEGVSLNPFTPSGYSLLFVTVLAMFFFSIFSEFRAIGQFAAMLLNLPIISGDKRKDRARQTWTYDKETQQYSIIGQTSRARTIGFVTIAARTCVGVYLLCLGIIFLIFTTLKIDLILNGLALVFLLELDSIVFLGSVTSTAQEFIDDIAPVQYPSQEDKDQNHTEAAAHFGPVLMFPFIFVSSLLVRWYQVSRFQRYFRMTAAICMFAGPTQPFARKDVIQPVAGFCDSLLGVSCAPDVKPESSRDEHGYCVVTDQTTISRPSVLFYMDDPKLFEGRFTADGEEKSWVQWGKADESLYESKHWMDGPYQDLLRKNCLSMYQKSIPPDDVMVDDDSGETMDGAPFLCAREPLFEAVFGNVVKKVDKTNSLRKIDSYDDHEGGLTHIAMDQVRALDDPIVIRAIDACKFSQVELTTTTTAPPEQKKEEEDASAPAPAEEESSFHLIKQKHRKRHRHRHRKHHHVDSDDS